MKRFRFLLVAMLLCGIATCFGKPLHLKGKWDYIKKTISIELPMDASIEESSNELIVNFHADLGSVMVEVTDANGMVVYQQQVETGDMSTVVIPLMDMEAGMLRITDGSNYVYGEFTIY